MSGGQTGKGVADATLNVVPFIDLLACTICFLLVSAVWTQLSRVNVEQALPKQTRTPTAPTQPPPRIDVAVTERVPYLHLVGALDAVLKVCTKPGDAASCLRGPAVGDVKLMRAEGMDVEGYRKIDHGSR